MTFSEEKIVFNTCCIFKLELETGQNYQIYLDFDLVHSTFTKSLNDGVPFTARKASVVDHRRVYINNHNFLNTFKRILFDDSDYFSLSDVYLLSQTMGEKIRIHNYQLSDFYGQSLEVKQQMHHEAFEQEMALGPAKNS